MTLNWAQDPLLLDSEPVPTKDWMTANHLLEAKTGTGAPPKQLTLYQILVRKSDFVRVKQSDRILARFPFIKLTEEWKPRIHAKRLLIAEVARDYFYNAINRSILKWRDSIDHYLERGTMPYPLYRCAKEILPNLPLQSAELAQSFESARGKRYNMPTTITPALAYLCGVINGDGHLSTHWLRVVDETKEHIEFIAQIFEKIFQDSGEIFQQGNAWSVGLRSSSAVRLFHYLTDQTIQGTKYDSLREPLIFKYLGEPFRKLYWRGAMDADGSYKQHISFGSKSQCYIIDFHEYLRTVGVKSKQGKIGNHAFQLTIPAIFRLKFIQHIGVTNPKKKADMVELFSKIRCTFRGLKQLKLIKGLYFNLLEIPTINVIGFTDEIINSRGSQSIKERSQELGIAMNQYQAYEKETRAIPIQTIQKIVKKSDKELMEIFSNQRQITYQIASSKPVRLPIRISDEIIEIMSILEPTSNYVKILLDKESVFSKIVAIFGLQPQEGRLYSRLIVNFCNTFGIYEKPDISELVLEPIAYE